MKDLTCLAEGQIFETDSRVTGLNLNEIIVGTTGCGKSFSTVYPRLLHTFSSSLVVPIAKQAVKEKFSKLFRDKGYEVLELNFAQPRKSNVGYDPLDYVHSNEDVINLARNLIETEPIKAKNVDPYWNNSATSILAAEIELIRLNAKYKKEKPCFADVIKLHREMEVDSSTSTIKVNLDALFEEADCRYPGNQASALWKTIQGLGAKTATCILSTLNSAIDKIMTDNIFEMMQMERKVDFENLGEKKTILFLVTSPMNGCLNNLVNLLYADMFRCLFEKAESHASGELEIPVHIVCDDFACGGRIRKFEEYISIFRAARISVTMLLQSESQLAGMYGSEAATTIINNCDTYVYMGGMDIETCQSISKRMNKPVDRVMGMPLEQVVVFRRGSMPVVARRYQTMNDSLYREIM